MNLIPNLNLNVAPGKFKCAFMKPERALVAIRAKVKGMVSKNFHTPFFHASRHSKHVVGYETSGHSPYKSLRLSIEAFHTELLNDF